MSYLPTLNLAAELAVTAIDPFVVTPTTAQLQNQIDDSPQKLSERLLGERRAPERLAPERLAPFQAEARTARSSTAPNGSGNFKPALRRSSGPNKPKKVRRRFFDVTWNCNDCGRNSTPVRRHGPAGPRSLCNACGLRRSKRRRLLLKAAANDSLAMGSCAADSFINQHAASSLRNLVTTGPALGVSAGGESHSLVEIEPYKPYCSIPDNQQSPSTLVSVGSTPLPFRETATATLYGHGNGPGGISIPSHPLQFVPNFNMSPSYLPSLPLYPKPQLSRRPSPQHSVTYEDASRRIATTESSLRSGLKPFSHGLDGLVYDRYMNAADQLSDMRTEGLQAEAWRESPPHQDTPFVGTTCRDSLAKAYPRASESLNWAPPPFAGDRHQAHRADSYEFQTNQTELTSFLDLLPIAAQVQPEIRANFQAAMKQTSTQDPSPFSSSDRICEVPDISRTVHHESYADSDGKW